MYAINVDLLLPEDFVVECEVRKISGPIIQQLEKLKKILNDEQNDPSLIPTRPHDRAYRQPKIEANYCIASIKEIKSEISLVIQEDFSKLDEIDSVETRLLHVRGRLGRLEYSKVVADKVRAAKESCDVLYAAISKIKSREITPDDSLVVQNLAITEEYMDECEPVQGNQEANIVLSSPSTTEIGSNQVITPQATEVTRNIGNNLSMPYLMSATPPPLESNISTVSTTTYQGLRVSSNIFQNHFTSSTMPPIFENPGNGSTNGLNAHINPYAIQPIPGQLPYWLGTYPPCANPNMYYQPYTGNPIINHSNPPTYPQNFIPETGSSHPENLAGAEFSQVWNTAIRELGLSGNNSRPVAASDHSVTVSNATQNLQLPTTQASSTPIISRNNVHRAPRSLTVPVHKWGISYSGSAGDVPVKTFLRRVELKALANDMVLDSLVWNLEVLLTGQAKKFYWNLIDSLCSSSRSNPSSNQGIEVELASLISWVQLRDEFSIRFEERRTDSDIRHLLEARKQRLSETFLEFHDAMCELATPLQIPLKTEDLIHILMRNMRLGLRVFLAGERFVNLPSLLTRCTGIEDNWKRNRYIPELTMGARTGVNEVAEFESDPQNIIPAETSTTIAEYRVSSQSVPSR